MTWVRIDESFPEHPKVSAAGGDAAWLHVCAMCYCNRFLTDGFVPTSVLARLSDRKRPTALAAKLVEVGIWDVTDNGWQIHDFLAYQPSKEKVENDRESARQRMANARGSSADVRPNSGRSSPNPSPSPSGPSDSLSSSSMSSNVRPIRDDDDQGKFMETIALMLEIKARKHPPRDRDAWEPITRTDLIAKKGDQVRAELAAGSTPIAAAGNILGSKVEAELAAQRLA